MRVKRLSVTRQIAAPASTVWELLVDVERWPEWGPSVRSASVDGGGPLRIGARGTVTTAVSVRLPFVITEFEHGRRWAWNVAGIPATDHGVEPADEARCCVRIGVPALALPYLAICRLALGRIDRLATT